MCDEAFCAADKRRNGRGAIGEGRADGDRIKTLTSKTGNWKKTNQMGTGKTGNWIKMKPNKGMGRDDVPNGEMVKGSSKINFSYSVEVFHTLSRLFVLRCPQKGSHLFWCTDHCTVPAKGS
jgi:hypothetical protein